MFVNQVLQRDPGLTQLAQPQFDLSRGPFKFLPYVPTNILALLTGKKTLSGVRRWARRHGVMPTVLDGTNFYDLRDVRDVVVRHGHTVARSSRARHGRGYTRASSM